METVGASIVGGGEKTNVVWMAVAEVLCADVGKVASAVAWAYGGAPAVADDHRFILAVGVVADFLESIGQIGLVQSIDTSQVKVGSRCHTAISSVGVVVGYGHV